MAILIKDMEMPEDCRDCRLLEGDRMDGLCHGASRWLDDDFFLWYQYPEGDIDDSKPLNCPLIEVPTPHGRLIDFDALPCPRVEWEDIEYAPTVIEAEEG